MTLTACIRTLFITLVLTYPFTLKTTAQQLPDSTVIFTYLNAFDSIRAEKKAFEYDPGGRETSFACYRWDTARSSWFGWPSYEYHEGAGRYEYQYDGSGHKTSTVLSNWSYDRNEWKYYVRIDSLFDDSGYLSGRQQSQWDSLNEKWIPVEGREFSFDEKGHQILMAIYFWDIVLNNWDPYHKFEYEYDPSGYLIRSTTWYSESGSRDWLLRYKNESCRDSCGNDILTIRYRWDTHTASWIEGSRTIRKTNDRGLIISEVTISNGVNSEMYEYGFDQWGNQIRKTFYRWDPNANAWGEQTLEESAFNESGDRLSYALYNWDKGTHDWRGMDKTDWEFDPTGFRTKEISYYWSSTTNSWSSSNFTQWEGDTRGRIKSMSLWHQNSVTDNWDCWLKVEYGYVPESSLLSLSTFYQDTGSGLKMYRREFYYYRPIIAGIETHTPLNVRVYPNPTTGTLNLEGFPDGTWVQILSPQATLVKSVYPHGGRIDVMDLTSGVYILKVMKGNRELLCTKLIRE